MSGEDRSQENRNKVTNIKMMKTKADDNKSSNEGKKIY